MIDTMTIFEKIPIDKTSIPQGELDIDNKTRSNLFAWNGQFSPQFVEALLNHYNVAFGTSIQITDLDADKPIMAQLKRLNGNKSFNHYSPANYMAKNIGTLRFSEETIDRFEKLFALVNSKFD